MLYEMRFTLKDKSVVSVGGNTAQEVAEWKQKAKSYGAKVKVIKERFGRD